MPQTTPINTTTETKAMMITYNMLHSAMKKDYKNTVKLCALCVYTCVCVCVCMCE